MDKQTNARASSGTIRNLSECVVPENIHTPTTEGISRETPPPSTPEFPFFDHKNTPPPHPSGISMSILNTPPYPLEKIVLARKCVKVKHSEHLTVCIGRHCCLS